MRKGLVLLVALLLAGALLQGCKAVKEKAKDNSKVLAIVNGEKITENDLQAELAGRPDSFRKIVESPEGRKMFVNRLVERKLLMQTAEKEEIAKNPEIERKVQVYRERLLMEELRKKITSSPENITDQDLQAYYEQNKSQYNFPEMAHLRKIAVSGKSKADQLLKQLKAAPNKFEELAKAESEDLASKMRGGDIGYVQRASLVSQKGGSYPLMTGNNLPPEIADKVFALGKNEISKVYQLEGKYVIFQMVDHRPAKEQTFDEAKEQIKRTLEFERTQAKWKEYLDGLKKQAKIEIMGEEQAPQNPQTPQNSPMPQPPQPPVPPGAEPRK